MIPRQNAPVAPTSADRIRAAALKLFAERGLSTTSLREVAKAAGTSTGLVQHYFGTKATLVAAVDDYVLGVISDALLSAPLPPPPGDTSNEMGRRVTTFMIEQPVVVDYLGRAIVEGGSIGSQVFDGLVRISAAKRDVFVERGEIRPDLDLVWAALLPVTLRVGAVIMRSHLDRHLPEAFNTPSQLMRWDDAVISLLREGQLRT